MGKNLEPQFTFRCDKSTMDKLGHIAKAHTRACLKIHSRHLYAPLCGIFGPNSGYIAHYAPFIWPKSPTNCDAHLPESNFQTHSRTRNQEMKYIIKEYIMSYEREHGEIEVTESEKPEIRIPILDPFHSGVKVGEDLGDMVVNQMNKVRKKKANN